MEKPTRNEIIAALKEKFPRITKAQLSMASNCAYGVVLSASAVRTLQDIYPDFKIDSRCHFVRFSKSKKTEEERMEEEALRNFFGNRLRKVWREKGVLPMDVAKDIGISETTLNKYLHSEDIPRTINLVKICEYFKVSADYLLGLEGIEDAD